MILTLNLKSEFFDQIKAGVKTEEYRKVKPYWKKRFENREYNEIHILKGYPKKDDRSRRLIFPWRGYDVKVITHPHFGDIPTKVYAIRLER